jgi:hypothetical protein
MDSQQPRIAKAELIGDPIIVIPGFIVVTLDKP